MLYSFGQVPLVVKSAKVNKGVPQLSVAVGVVHDGVPEHSIVVTPGRPEITGGAVQVRVMLYEPAQESVMVTSAKVNTGTSQLSVAVGVVHDGTPEHSMVDGPGKPEMTGGIVSSTFIV